MRKWTNRQFEWYRDNNEFYYRLKPFGLGRFLFCLKTDVIDERFSLLTEGLAIAIWTTTIFQQEKEKKDYEKKMVTVLLTAAMMANMQWQQDVEIIRFRSDKKESYTIGIGAVCRAWLSG